MLLLLSCSNLTYVENTRTWKNIRAISDEKTWTRTWGLLGGAPNPRLHHLQHRRRTKKRLLMEQFRLINR
ncbi:hypothetical protein KM043_007936 [Ampulex compressa]|nr:hypothetical protein KM043_007936 [Ampulex compressa]